MIPAPSAASSQPHAALNALRRALQAAPLLAAAWLLAQVAAVAREPLGGSTPIPWRVDALTLLVTVGLCLAVGLPAAQGRAQNDETFAETLRALLALVLVSVGALFEHLLILPAALLLAGAVLGSWRWVVAAGTLFAANLLLRAAGGTTWLAPQTAGALTPPIFLLLVAAVWAGLPCYPAALLPERPSLARLRLQPVWLLPLLRSFEWGPWNTGWTLAVTLLGAATALVSAAAALWSADDAERVDHIARTWLGAALLAVGLATPVAAAAAMLWIVGYGLGLALLQPAAHQRDRWALRAAAFPPALGFVAFWLVQGAAAASGSFLLAALLWLALLLTCLAALRLPFAPSGLSTSTLLAAISLVLGVLAPLVLRTLVLPAVGLLQGGLTPYGLLDIWPWVGVAALDAGQRRVAVLPSIAVALMALVVTALAWLVARLLGWIGGEPAAEGAAGWPWPALRERVWWARGRRRG